MVNTIIIIFILLDEQTGTEGFSDLPKATQRVSCRDRIQIQDTGTRKGPFTSKTCSFPICIFSTHSIKGLEL